MGASPWLCLAFVDVDHCFGASKSCVSGSNAAPWECSWVICKILSGVYWEKHSRVSQLQHWYLLNLTLDCVKVYFCIHLQKASAPAENPCPDQPEPNLLQYSTLFWCHKLYFIQMHAIESNQHCMLKASTVFKYSMGFFFSSPEWQEKMRKVEDIVKDHLLYLDAVHEFTDWLHSAKEELHRWSDASGDTPTIQKKLAKINVSEPSWFLLQFRPYALKSPSQTVVGFCSFFLWNGDHISVSWKQAFQAVLCFWLPSHINRRSKSIIRPKLTTAHMETICKSGSPVASQKNAA